MLNKLQTPLHSRAALLNQLQTQLSHRRRHLLARWTSRKIADIRKSSTNGSRRSNVLNISNSSLSATATMVASFSAFVIHENRDRPNRACTSFMSFYLTEHGTTLIAMLDHNHPAHNSVLSVNEAHPRIKSWILRRKDEHGTAAALLDARFRCDVLCRRSDSAEYSGGALSRPCPSRRRSACACPRLLFASKPTRRTLAPD
eukprot:m.82082 g.82082  ORF g.82082 m.82082 type:complete len:201 (+) comp50768_c0_seq4:788-1390(+)